MVFVSEYGNSYFHKQYRDLDNLYWVEK